MVPNQTPHTGASPQQESSPAERNHTSSMPTIRRVQTLEAMEHAISLCARHLFDARDKFNKAREDSSDSKHQIHLARRNVTEALESLHPIQSLIAVRPGEITHTSNCMNRTTAQIETILRVSRRLVLPSYDRHYTAALAALASRCDRTSSHLQNSLAEPIKRARQEISKTNDGPSNAFNA
jgi:hypothetical protein